MKSILALFSLIVVATGQPPVDPVPPVGKVAETKLDGLWVRYEGKRMGIKHFAGGRMAVSYLDRDTSTITHHMTAAFTLDESKSTEFPKFTTKNWRDLRIKFKSFQVSFAGDGVYTQAERKGAKEVWNRAGDIGGKTPEDVSEFLTVATALDGAWLIKDSPRQVALKIFDRGKIYTTQIDLVTRDVLNHSIGIFSLKDGLLKERTLYATEKWGPKIGSTQLWKASFNDGSYTQTGPDGKQTETYLRIVGDKK